MRRNSDKARWWWWRSATSSNSSSHISSSSSSSSSVAVVITLSFATEFCSRVVHKMVLSVETIQGTQSTYSLSLVAFCWHSFHFMYSTLCVEWDVKPYTLTHSLMITIVTYRASRNVTSLPLIVPRHLLSQIKSLTMAPQTVRLCDLWKLTAYQSCYDIIHDYYSNYVVTTYHYMYKLQPIHSHLPPKYRAVLSDAVY